MPNNWKNTFHENLIKAFCEKAKIDRNAVSLFKVLNSVYSNCYLPNSRTFERFLNGETKNPRETVLGFMSAYVLDIPNKEVELADLNNSLDKYYFELIKVLTDALSKQSAKFPIHHNKIDFSSLNSSSIGLHQ